MTIGSDFSIGCILVTTFLVLNRVTGAAVSSIQSRIESESASNKAAEIDLAMEAPGEIREETGFLREESRSRKKN